MPDDLIPRSKAIEALKAAKEKGNIFWTPDPENKPNRTPHAFVILRKALDAIDAIPAVEDPETNYKWISTQDYVPTAKDACNGQVWAINKNYMCVKTYWWKEVAYYPEEFICWMPMKRLPQPPKEVHHETD